MIKKITIGICVIFIVFCQAQTETDDTQLINKPQEIKIIKTKIIVPKDPVLSGLLAAQLPGVGHIYCRKWIKGAIFLVGTASLYGIANECNKRAGDDSLSQEERDQNAALAGVLGIAGLTVHIWNVIDAINMAERYNRRLLEDNSQEIMRINFRYNGDKVSLGLAKSF
ncbi:hypothetical protein A2Y85_03055 [candidate division WOR-3 bacterium RBG_13_43_14]|uniref:DUF5683 domain-containing protein n=1 Tax=candidate division WOR-3 bacterium RBG_13_43_14 TaxID=1802590 RepID=A0A1F4UDK6_UNCW3|nr:MAG: hypothetical protein A2Y85_03055 [candidate division WOR-3 bacterium RBG_13_43_14]